MKKSFYSIGSIIILILAAFAFVFAGAADGCSQKTGLPEYGSYKGKPIKYEDGSEFQKAVLELENYYEAQGVDLNSEYASMFYSQIFAQAFQNVVGSFALEYFTDSTGYTVPTAARDRTILNLSVYKDDQGKFSRELYDKYTTKEKLEVQESTVKQLKQMRSYEDMFGSLAEVGYSPIYGLKSSSNEIEFIRKMGEKEYSFDAVAFDMKSYPDSEKVAFGKAHSDLFVEYNLKVISCESEAKAKEVVKRISNSEITFEDAIVEYSKSYYGDPETGVLSANRKYQLSTAVVKPEDLDVITSLEPETISPVIETASGYCVFKSTGAPADPDFTDPQTITTVYSYLLTREKTVIEDYYSNIAKDFASKAKATDYKSAAAASGVSVTSVSPFALNYNDTVLIGKSQLSGDAVLSYAISNENFYKTAFKLKKDEISGPIVLSEANSVVVVKCTDIRNGGTSAENAKDVIAPAIDQASKSSINYSILESDNIKNNAAAFMAAFNK